MVVIGVESLKEVLAHQVREVRVTYLLAETMGAVWIVWGYRWGS